MCDTPAFLCGIRGEQAIVCKMADLDHSSGDAFLEALLVADFLKEGRTCNEYELPAGLRDLQYTFATMFGG